MAKYLERSRWETCQNVARFHEQLISPSYMSVSQAYMLCSEQVSVNNLLGKTIVQKRKRVISVFILLFSSKPRQYFNIKSTVY